MLRWFQPQFAWVCDRCRGIFPAAMPGAAAVAVPGFGPGVPRAVGGPGPAPGQPPMFGAGVLAAARPPAKVTLSKKQWIALAVGAGVIALGLIAYKVFVAGGGGSTSSGVAKSRDELVQRMVAALNAHDLDAAMKLADYEGLKRRAMDCDDEDGDGADRDAERIRDGFEQEIRRTKDLTIELAKLDTAPDDADHKAMTLDKGDTAGEGCKFKVDVELQTIQFSVTLTKDGKPRTKEVEMYALVLDGNWHLLSPPSLQGTTATPDCWEATRNAMTLSATEMRKMNNMDDAKLESIKYAMSELCRADSWSEDVLTCLTDASSQPDVEACMKKLTSSQMSAVTAKLVDIVSADSYP